MLKNEYNSLIKVLILPNLFNKSYKYFYIKLKDFKQIIIAVVIAVSEIIVVC